MGELPGRRSPRAIPPPDDIAHRDGVLMAKVTEITTLLSRYVLRHLDADAGRGPALPPAEEHGLADRVAAVALELHGRAARRDRLGDPSPFVHRTHHGSAPLTPESR